MTSAISPIPCNLLLFWHDKDYLPEPVKAAIELTILRNPDYRVLFADDANIVTLLQSRGQNRLLEIYQRNQIPASRSDLARLVLLLAFGGIYVDAAMECFKPLDTLLTPPAELVLVRRDDRQMYADNPEKAHVVNSLMAAIPGHPMLREALNIAIGHLEQRQHNHDVWMATGANCLNLILEKYQALSRIQILSYSALQDDFFVYRRVRGVSNSWVIDQADGILAEKI